MMKTNHDKGIRGLYAVTPDEPDTHRLLHMVEAALEGGARLVQYRNKVASDTLRLEQARALVGVCRRFSVPLIVNDRLDIALAVDSDGVHLGRDDGDLEQARKACPGKLLGVSCYNEITRAIAAERAGADYVAFGRFFASVTKPGDIRASIPLVAQARQTVKLPIVAIGGITEQHTPDLIAGGVDAVAVVSAVFSTPDVRSAARAFAMLFGEGE
jgi:thiamine-phosphate pyrophosphorylase